VRDFRIGALNWPTDSHEDAKMKQHITGQIVLSTCVDSQGEQLSEADLRSILSGVPAKVPLHQHHDFSLPVCGEMKNFRMEKHPGDPAHSVIVCDVTLDDDQVEGTSGGFSFSACCAVKANSNDPDFEVYLPFPHYNDQAAIESILKADSKIVVGKWLKKSVDPVLVAMIVILLKQAWDTAYKSVLEEKIKRLIEAIKNRLPAQTSLNFSAEVPIQLYTPRPLAILLPEKGAGIESLATFEKGIETAKSFCESDFCHYGKRISRIKLALNSGTGKYTVIGVQYLDGSHRVLGV
jgi:hypothetical protein